MRKFIIIAASLAALAVPTAALAGNSTGVSTNGNTNDAIGFCVSAGNYNYHQDGTTTGADRSSRAGQPGANAALIAGVRANCASWETPYAPPGQP
jgi:hypothetical protein